MIGQQTYLVDKIMRNSNIVHVTFYVRNTKGLLEHLLLKDQCNNPLISGSNLSRHIVRYGSLYMDESHPL
jgi:hypothetical protein